MNLETVILENFRGYKGRHVIPIGALTALIGKNDAGKSSVFDALAAFFEHPLGKIDFSDVCIHAGAEAELRIGCVFSDFPESVTIDSSSETTLEKEFLLNSEGLLEVHKIYPFADGKLKKSRTVAISEHPVTYSDDSLLHQKNAELKRLAADQGVDTDVDKRSNVALRRRLWEAVANDPVVAVEVQLDKEDAKAIWTQVSNYLPEFALFRADRPSSDEDAEVQDPLKVAIRNAITEVEQELELIKERVRRNAIDVAKRTIESLEDFDSTLASELTPIFKSEPKWDSLFKLSLTGDDEIPINKRGSGVRRLVLFSFFRAEAERRRTASHKGNVIYAIEEPETAQHPDNQRKIVQTLKNMSETVGCQVMLTTHVPGLAGLLEAECVRYVTQDSNGKQCIEETDDEVISRIVNDLGILPDKRARVLVCVEGPHDVRFLRIANKAFRDTGEAIVDLSDDPRVCFVVLGGSTLQEWVNQHFLKSVGLPEVHIYDRDEEKDGKYKYEEARDNVNSRKDGSIAFLTDKREMENYLHDDAILEVFDPITDCEINVSVTDECDVEKLLKDCIGQGICHRRKLKHWLNQDVASCMTVEMYRERGGYDEILKWMEEITSRAESS